MAIILSISDILAASGGRLLTGLASAQFSTISIDSRSIKPGQLFWSLKGERFDSHDFVLDSVKKGATAVVVGEEFCIPPNWPEDKVLIQVADRLHALQETACYWREKFHVPLVAVTGSNGKTTTKEMIASILTEAGRVLKTEGNQNNLIGLPLTLCRLSNEIEFAVLELGMNKLGEIKRLTQICRPQIGVVTNIGPAHIEFFQSLDMISLAKGELFEEMNTDSIAIVNNDDPYCQHLADGRQAKIITFGLKEGNMVWANDIQPKEGMLSFTLGLNGESIKIILPLIGRHNVYNALAAAAAARALDIPLPLIAQGLQKVVLPGMRMLQIKTRQGYSIINDAYNANPISMRIAVQTLVDYRGNGRTILVLGDMLELGKESKRFHWELGEAIASYPIDFLFTCGQFADWIGKGALSRGMEKTHVILNASHSLIAENLRSMLRAGDCVLVKGSRGAKMEKIVDLLMDE